MVYHFQDTDHTGFEEYDVTGDDYIALIKFLFSKAKYLSLYLTEPNTSVEQRSQPFAIECPSIITFDRPFSYWGVSRERIGEERYYQACPELQDIFIQEVPSIMQWVDCWGCSNPTDPVFFREDGSLLFTSIIHEGYCDLYLNEGEEPPPLGLGWTCKKDIDVAF